MCALMLCVFLESACGCWLNAASGGSRRLRPTIISALALNKIRTSYAKHLPKARNVAGLISQASELFEGPKLAKHAIILAQSPWRSLVLVKSQRNLLASSDA